MENIEELLKLVDIDKERVDLAKKRMAALFRWEKPDQWPLCVTAPLTDAQENGIPKPEKDRRKHTFQDRLHEWLRVACNSSNARSDAIPFIYANFGTAILLSCIGLEQELRENGYWPPGHFSREEVKSLEPDMIKVQGAFKEGMDYMKYVREVLGDTIDICYMDAQSPFDLAHLIMGDDIFIAIYDDPALVHHLLEFCTELYIKTVTWMKKALNEPLGHANVAGGGRYSENWGVKLSEDTAVLISTEMIEEFVLPYSLKVAKAFNGAAMHYCGRHDGLTKLFCESPEIKVINFGHVPGKQHDQPFEKIMELCIETKKVYSGYWPVRDNETIKEYLKRMHSWSSQGCLLTNVNLKSLIDMGNCPFDNAAQIMDFWYGLN